MVANNIVFYFPSKTVGGANLLFMRNAIRIADTTSYNVYFADLDDGFTVDKIRESTVKHLSCAKNKRTIIPSNSVLICQLNLIDRLYEMFEFEGDHRVLFWCIHPDNLRGKTVLNNKTFVPAIIKKSVGKEIKKLVEDGVIQFMDYANYMVTSRCLHFDADRIGYLPVPIDETKIVDTPKKHLKEQGKIHVAWLGRLSFDKVNTLKTIMNELEDLKSNLEVCFHIVGNGEYYEDVKRFSEKFSYSIIFHNTLIGSELDDFIDNNVDLGVAMGTSNLEFAKRGVPAILKGIVNEVKATGQEKDYIYTSEIEGYTLGTIEGYEIDYKQGDTFANKMNYVVEDYAKLAKECLVYVQNNHTISSTSSGIIQAVENLSRAEWVEVEDSISKVKCLLHVFSKVQKHVRTLNRVIHNK